MSDITIFAGEEVVYITPPWIDPDGDIVFVTVLQDGSSILKPWLSGDILLEKQQTKLILSPTIDDVGLSVIDVTLDDLKSKTYYTIYITIKEVAKVEVFVPIVEEPEEVTGTITADVEEFTSYGELSINFLEFIKIEDG